MSLKRQATTELNHDNWDQEEPAESNEIGTFKTASKEVLEKRVIRTAKRRAPISSSEANKSIFQNTKFGENKPIPSSFDFLANLTNQNKNTNGSTGNTSVTSSLTSFKPNSPSGGLFGNHSALTASKSSSETPLSASTSGKTASSMFAATKADTKINESPFKIQNPSTTPKLTASATPPITSNVFGASSSANSTPFKLQAESSTTTNMTQSAFGTSTKTLSPNTGKKDNIFDEKRGDTSDKNKDETNEKKMSYYFKLKGLNECVSAWISKHVEKTPLCILTPIFKDYEKYLKEIMEEYKDVSKEAENKVEGTETKSSTLFGTNTQQPTSFGGASKSPSKLAPFNDSTSDKPKFSFGIVTSPNNKSDTTTTNTGFSFGVVTSNANSSTSSPFSSHPSTPTSTPFSFGINKPFSLSPNNNPQNKVNETTEDTEEEPPKVEYTPVKEDNCVFEVTCKVFVKKDGNFGDKGVGTLYIKEIKETKKYQLLVRANTNLGTILLNSVLSSSIPMQRAGKNNVMLVCIPTQDAKPPPTPVLIRVKTAEGADDLLATLKKYTS